MTSQSRAISDLAPATNVSPSSRKSSIESQSQHQSQSNVRSVAKTQLSAEHSISQQFQMANNEVEVISGKRCNVRTRVLILASAVAVVGVGLIAGEYTLSGFICSSVGGVTDVITYYLFKDDCQRKTRQDPLHDDCCPC